MTNKFVCIATRLAAPVSIRIEATELLPRRWLGQLPEGAELIHSVTSDSAELVARYLNEELAKSYERDDFGFLGLGVDVVVSMADLAKAAADNMLTKQSVEQRKHAADDANQRFEQACEYWYGSTRTLMNPQRAFSLFVELAHEGLEAAYPHVAMAYLFGRGVSQDLQAALDWAHRSIAAGDWYSYHLVATVFALADDRDRVEEVWKECFSEVRYPFVDQEPTALDLLAYYGRHCVQKMCREVHSIDAKSAFRAAADRLERVAFFPVEETGAVVSWLRARQL